MVDNFENYNKLNEEHVQRGKKNMMENPDNGSVNS